MPVPKAILKEQLQQLSKQELVEMVLKLSTKRYNYEYLLVNYLDPEGGEQTLFEEAKEDVYNLFYKPCNGRTIQHQLAKKLNRCTKRIKEFSDQTKSKKLEADIILYLLELQFENHPTFFGAHYSGYDYKVALLLKKLISLVSKKLHPDYFVDYQDEINDFLNKIHHTSNRINTVYDLPKEIQN